MTLTDAIQLAKEGKSVEWSTIIIAVYKEKYFVTSKYIKNDADIKKILNEAYVKALSNITFLSNPADFSKWIGIVIANIAKTLLQGKNTSMFAEEKQNTAADSYKSFPKGNINFNANSLALSNEEIKKISAALLSPLTNAQKVSLLLYCFEDLSAAEISKSLQCTEKAVHSFLNNGIHTVKTKIAELQKSNSKLSVISNPVSFLTYILNSEFDLFDYNLADATINKIIEDAAAVVAEKNYKAEEKEQENVSEEENETEEKTASSNKKAIIIAAVLLIVIAGIVFAVINITKKPSAPVNNSNTVSDISDLSESDTEALTDESASETETESSSDISQTNETTSSSSTRAPQSTRPSYTQPNTRPQTSYTTTTAPAGTTASPSTTLPPATEATTAPTTSTTQTTTTSAPEPDPEPEPTPDPVPEEPVDNQPENN